MLSTELESQNIGSGELQELEFIITIKSKRLNMLS